LNFARARCGSGTRQPKGYLEEDFQHAFQRYISKSAALAMMEESVQMLATPLSAAPAQNVRKAL
jgi:hypothetical protein